MNHRLAEYDLIDSALGVPWRDPPESGYTEVRLRLPSKAREQVGARLAELDYFISGPEESPGAEPRVDRCWNDRSRAFLIQLQGAT